MTKNQIFQVYGGPLCMAIDFFYICPNYFVFLFIFFIFSFSFLSIFFHFEKTTTATTKRKEKKNTSKINVFFFFLIEKKSDMAHDDQRSISTVAHNCYGKTKKVTAKPNSSRKNQKAQGKTK